MRFESEEQTPILNDCWIFDVFGRDRHLGGNHFGGWHDFYREQPFTD